jgi:hypothetical protein
MSTVENPVRRLGPCFRNRRTYTSFDAATARWGVAQAIEDYVAGNAWTPQVAMDPNGNAIAVWVQGEAVTGQIWSNRLEQP